MTRVQIMPSSAGLSGAASQIVKLPASGTGHYQGLGVTSLMPISALCAESFFGHLKREFSDGSDFSQPGRFIRALDDWIAWYNNGRIKESLCGMAPVEYRLAHAR